MKFSLNIKWVEIENARKAVIAKHQSSAQIKGFRKGKAPLKLVEGQIGEQHIVEDILDKVLPKAYADEVTAKKLKPLTMPKITPTAIKTGEDWKFDVEIAQKPEVSLGDYKKYIKAALSKAKEPTKEELEKNPDQDPKLIAIFDSLLEKSECIVPQLLVEQEANDQLNRLATQIERLGLSIEKYLESTKMSVDQLKAEYQKSAANNLKLEFILQKLIEELKITVDEKEIATLIDSVGDEHTKSHLNTQKEREGIHYMLAKRKVVDHLKTL